MFRHREVAIFTIFALCLFGLWWSWNDPAETRLQSGFDTVSGERWKKDLGGEFEKYNSLGEALQGQNPDRIIYIPSNAPFKIIAKEFQIGGEWAARNVRLVVCGLQDDAVVYLNGTDSAHRLGELKKNQIQGVISIPPSLLNYGADNRLIICSKTNAAVQSINNQCKIFGSIYLEAVSETTLAEPKIHVSWEGTTAKVQVVTALEHHNILENGPWTVRAYVSDGSEGIAEETREVAFDGSKNQILSFDFTLPEVKAWSPADPYLYELYLSVINSQGGKDDLSVSFGICDVKFQEGLFYINNQNLKIQGKALTPNEEQKLRSSGQIENFLLEEKNRGTNLIYFLNQYPDELWFKYADRLGMGIWAELPNSLLLASELEAISQFNSAIELGNRHPSLWAWTIGKGILGEREKIISYIEDSQQFLADKPGFILNQVATDLKSYNIIVPSEQQIGESWGRIILEETAQEHAVWQGEKEASVIWAIIVFFIIFGSFRTVNWRYKEIGTEKPKRRLRRAWRWHRMAHFGRAGTLAGIFTSILYRIPYSLNPWFEPNNLLVQLTRQSPWLIWAILTLLLIFLRWLQVGVAAPFLPEKPHPIGLTYWLERRYRWIFIVAILWALTGWGLPIYVPLLTYFGFNLFFFPVRVKDIRRAGGKYRPLLFVPMVWMLILVVGMIIWRSELYYLYLYFSIKF